MELEGGRHEQRLEEILNEGPVAEVQQKRTFKQKAVGFCGSRVGMAIGAFILVFLLLLCLQPNYIYKKTADNQRSLKHVNYVVVLIIALLSSLCVFFIPYFIDKQK